MAYDTGCGTVVEQRRISERTRSQRCRNVETNEQTAAPVGTAFVSYRVLLIEGLLDILSTSC